MANTVTYYANAPELGFLSERIAAGKNITWRNYVMADGEMVAIRLSTSSLSGTTTSMYYPILDHLGSMAAVVDGNQYLANGNSNPEYGQAIDRYSYDPFGMARFYTNWAPLDCTKGPQPPFVRGFTGQEHLPDNNSGIAGGVSGAISSGSLKGALMGGLEGAAFFQVGTFLQGENGSMVFDSPTATAALAHGMVGGLFSIGQKGGFPAGFLSAAMATAADSPALDSGPIGDIVAHAVAGGAGAVLGGGKFENGAVTGAFAYLFNDAAHAAASADNTLERAEALTEKALDPYVGVTVKTGVEYGVRVDMANAFQELVGWMEDKSDSDLLVSGIIKGSGINGRFTTVDIPADASTILTAHTHPYDNVLSDCTGCDRDIFENSAHYAEMMVIGPKATTVETRAFVPGGLLFNTLRGSAQPQYPYRN